MDLNLACESALKSKSQPLTPTQKATTKDLDLCIHFICVLLCFLMTLELEKYIFLFLKYSYFTGITNVQKHSWCPNLSEYSYSFLILNLAMLKRKKKGEMIWYKHQFWSENIFSYEALIVLQLANTSVDTVVKPRT